MAAVVATTIACGASPQDRANEVIAAAAERYGTLGEELTRRMNELQAKREQLECPPNDTRPDGMSPEWQVELVRNGLGSEEFEASQERRGCIDNANNLRLLVQGSGRLAGMFTAEQMDELVTRMEQRLAELEPGQIEAALETAENEHEAYANVFELASRGWFQAWREPEYYHGLVDDLETDVDRELEEGKASNARYEEVRAMGIALSNDR